MKWYYFVIAGLVSALVLTSAFAATRPTKTEIKKVKVPKYLVPQSTEDWALLFKVYGIKLQPEKIQGVKFKCQSFSDNKEWFARYCEVADNPRAS